MFWRRKRPWRDLAEELESHVVIESDQLQEQGKSPSAADTAALRSMGNTTAVLEAYYVQGRWLWWDQVSRDVMHALRLFRRRPGFTAVVILTLALGIGASTAIFSVIDAVLLRPLPYREPDRLAMLWSEDSAREMQEGRVSLLNFADWKSRTHSFEDLTVFVGQTFLLGNNDGPPVRMRSARVEVNFFSLLGVKPIRGRIFSDEEEKKGDAAVVIGAGLWQRRFGGSEQALGSYLMMDGRPSRIIGIMPESFQDRKSVV